MDIASVSRQSHDDVHALLKRLWRSNVIRYIPTNHDPMIFLEEERLPARDVYIAPKTYTHRKSLMLERFNRMLHYANDEEECRSRIIEQYFCNKKSEPCGICDNCLARKRREKSQALYAEKNIEEQIIERLQNQPMTVKELVASIRSNEQSILDAIHRLTEKSAISAKETKLKLTQK